MRKAKINKCRDCWKPAQTDYLGLCDVCAGNPVIVNEKINARRITKEIREGLVGFYRELRNEAKTRN